MGDVEHGFAKVSVHHLCAFAALLCGRRRVPVQMPTPTDVPSAPSPAHDGWQARNRESLPSRAGRCGEMERADVTGKKAVPPEKSPTLGDADGALGIYNKVRAHSFERSRTLIVGTAVQWVGCVRAKQSLVPSPQNPDRVAVTLPDSDSRASFPSAGQAPGKHNGRHTRQAFHDRAGLLLPGAMTAFLLAHSPQFVGKDSLQLLQSLRCMLSFQRSPSKQIVPSLRHFCPVLLPG